MTKEEFEMYKKDIMANLKKEREKIEEVEFNEEFDFSKDFSSNNLGHELGRPSDEYDDNDISALDNGMEDVKELKRLLTLAKMKLRKENPTPTKKFQQRAIKVKRKGRNLRKVKTGYEKKRLIKNSQDKMLDNNIFSYQAHNMRGKISTGNTNQNKMSREYLHQDSLFSKHDKEYVLKMHNLVRNNKHEHQASIDHNDFR